MKKIIFSILITVLFYNTSFSQCREFTTQEVVSQLDNYILTGKYHYMKLAEGEEILIFKTLNKGLGYRFIIMGQQEIPQPNFVITDWDNSIIYDSNKEDNKKIFDYVPNSTKRIKILIKVPKTNDKENKGIKEGCVSLVIGIKSI